MIDFIYQWIDLLWLPVAWFAVHKKHRAMSLAFVVACLLTMRTQIELMAYIGYPTGILPVLNSEVFLRSIVVYGFIIGLFLLLARFSPGTQKIVFFAASLSMYIMGFCISMVIMAL